ncbi:MAG: hypothetical protein JNK16_10280 [Phycisphaerales bacterium]|nr:hypothetical protein [Phycisphaerales bacterium]
MLIAMLLSSVMSLSVLTEPVAPEAKAPEAAPAPEVGPTVKMIETGAEPRALARLALKPGDVQLVTMDMDMQMKMAMDGVASPTPRMPTVTFQMRIAVDEALPSGWWKYTCGITGLDVKATEQTPPEMATMMKALVSEMVGMTMSAEVDTLGHQRNFAVVSKITNPMLLQQLESMKQSLTQMSLALPEPEIGVGAKWGVETVATLGGVSSRQRTTYRLISREGDTIRLGISVQQSPGEKDSPIRNLPEGITGTLIDLAGDSRGELLYNLTSVIAKEGRVTGESVVNMNMEGQGMKAKVDTQTTIAMTIRSTGAADSPPAQPKP